VSHTAYRPLMVPAAQACCAVCAQDAPVAPLTAGWVYAKVPGRFAGWECPACIGRLGRPQAGRPQGTG
jgi:hypothetical protein